MKRLVKALLAFVLIFGTFAPALHTVEANTSLYQLPAIGDAGSIVPNAATFSPNGKYLATNDYGSVMLWNAASLSLIQTVKVGSSSIRKMVFSADGEKLLISANEYLIQLDVASAITDFSKLTTDYNTILDIAYNQTGDFIYVLKYNKLLIYNKDGSLKDEFALTNSASSFAYNAQTDELAIAFENGEVIIRQASTGDYIRTIAYDGETYDNYEYTFVQYSRDFKTLYRIYTPEYADRSPVSIATLNVEDEYKETPLHNGKFNYDFGSIHSFIISPNNQYLIVKGEYLVSNYYNNTTVIFELATQTAVAEITGSGTNNIAMTADNKRLFTGNTLYNAEKLPLRQLTGIAITPEQTIMGIDDVQTLQASHVFSDGLQQPLNNADVKWSSSNSNVAAFIGGKLQGISAGEATITASYNNFNTTQKIIVRNFIEQPKATDVAADKVWTIEFNTNVNVQTIKQQNIYVTNAKDEIVPMLYYVEQSNGKNVQLMPVTPYTSGETYTIWVKDVKSSGNVSLDQFTKKQFTIK